MRVMPTFLLAAALSPLWPARAAVARMTVHTSPDLFRSVAGPVTTFRFSGTAGGKPNPFVVGPLEFRCATAAYGTLHDPGGYGRDTMFYSPGSGGTVTIGGEVHAASFVVGTYYRADTIRISVNGGTPTSIATSGGKPATRFVGFTSDTPIATVTFSIGGSELDFIQVQLGPLRPAQVQPSQFRPARFQKGHPQTARPQRGRAPPGWRPPFPA